MKIWFQLVFNLNGDPYNGSTTTQVKVNNDDNIDDLKKEIKKECSNGLSTIDASKLLVYENKQQLKDKISIEEDQIINNFGKTKASALLVLVPETQKGIFSKYYFVFFQTNIFSSS